MKDVQTYWQAWSLEKERKKERKNVLSFKLWKMFKQIDTLGHLRKKERKNERKKEWKKERMFKV